MPSATPSACTLRFPDLGREITALGNESVLQAARRHGVRLVGACGGRGTCGSCAVRVVSGTVEATRPDGETALGKKWLRACEIRPRSDCVLEINRRSLAPVVRHASAPDKPSVAWSLAPAVHSIDVELSAPSLNDNRADADRLLDALGSPVAAIDLDAARRLPDLLRQHGWAVRARVRDAEVIQAAPRRSPTLGLAVDLGTTKVAAFLVDLQSGLCLAELGIENPQGVWGADLVSRIDHALTGDGAAQLQQNALAAINALAHDLAQAAEASSSDIVDVVVCGNTAMHHLLLKLPVRQLGRAPFVAAVRRGLDLKARELGLVVAPGAWVHVVGNIGGFVGGDHVTALLATESQWQGSAATLVMDIGTNTEISLVHGGRILSASCPSGPALEAGNISCGMRAAVGAIDRVTFAEDRIAVTTIGSRAAVGVCGSGVVDTVATLLRAGIIDPRGRLCRGMPAVQEVTGQRAARLSAAVTFNQADVRAVQLAKAAIGAGVELLLREAAIDAADIGRLLLAGAFGAHLDVASGIAIGLLPALPRERFLQVGNAAGVGAQQLLASRSARIRAGELAASCRHIELGSRRDFQNTFLRHIAFPGRSPS